MSKIIPMPEGYAIDIKRFYLGVVYRSPEICPGCGEHPEVDLGSDYLSYPRNLVPQTVIAACACEERSHAVKVTLRVDVAFDETEVENVAD